MINFFHSIPLLQEGLGPYFYYAILQYLQTIKTGSKSFFKHFHTLQNLVKNVWT